MKRPPTQETIFSLPPSHAISLFNPSRVIRISGTRKQCEVSTCWHHANSKVTAGDTCVQPGRCAHTGIYKNSQWDSALSLCRVQRKLQCRHLSDATVGTLFSWKDKVGTGETSYKPVMSYEVTAE